MIIKSTAVYIPKCFAETNHILWGQFRFFDILISVVIMYTMYVSWCNGHYILNHKIYNVACTLLISDCIYEIPIMSQYLK